jgi:tetraacyldisaccharide 4'-kinase
MEGDFIKVNDWLLPFSWIYGWGVRLRNFLFDVGILKSRSFAIPVISVGNITVGGTGKTPHVEYLIRLLKDKTHVAVLSRGYKRKSKGFVLASDTTSARDIGDEPYQMKRKFPNVVVAVDRNRVHGIETITQTERDVDVVLLDDAFQHRYVKPGVNILLVDYHRLIIYDKLLPAGRLREPLNGKNRADVVIVTKCPRELKPMDFRVITKAMNLYPYQHLYFTTLRYDKLRPVFGSSPKQARQHTETLEKLDDLKGYHVLLLTGIASPRQMAEDLSPLASNLVSLAFADHHNFTSKDVQRINDTFASLPEPRCIITTEKDTARLTDIEGLDPDVRARLYVLPVRIEFMLEQEDNFNQNIIGYVRKNSRNSILVKAKDDYKPKDSHCAGDRPRTISFRDN